MKKITVGDKEYFIDDQLFTISDMDRIVLLYKTEHVVETYEFCQSIIRKCLGVDVYGEIPLSDFSEVFSKTLAELCFPKDSSAKEKLIVKMMKSFNI